MNSPWFAVALLVAAVLGWLLAVAVPDLAWLNAVTDFLRTAFLAALKMIIAPLIFFSLISGVLQLRRAGNIGRLGSVTLLFYLGTSAIAIMIGLTVVLFIHPWTAYPPLTVMPPADLELIDAQAGSAAQLFAGLARAIFANPFSALAELNILGILANALLIGLAAAWALPADSQWPRMIGELTQVIYRMATWVLTALPLGLFAITHQLADQIDVALLVSLGHFVGVVFGATAFHGLVVLPLLAWWLGGLGPRQFLSRVGQPMLTAFLTSSSAATLPLSLRTAEERLGVDKGKAAFVLPLGATVNMDGTALFEGVAVVFLAYMFNVPLDGLSLIVVFFITMLASAGAPGIPSGSMAGLQTVLLAVGIPLEAIGLVLLIERPLDTFRTAVNVEGDLVGALVAERFG